MAAAHKQYTAIFAIGAKMLGSFRGVMASAQTRMARLRASSSKMAASTLGFISRLGAGLGLLAGFGVAAVFHKIFGEAGKEAREAEQRTRALTAALMTNEKIRKGGPAVAQKQLELIYKHNQGLEEQGVLHKDILDVMSVQLALKSGLPPAELQNANDVLQNILVTTKGIAATEGDAASLANAYAAAVSKGRLLGLTKQGVTITKEFAKAFSKLTSVQARQNALMKLLGKNYQGVNKAARETPLGRIQLFQNALKSISQEIGNEMLPLQAQMADAWLEALPVTKPAIIGILKTTGNAAIWAGRQVRDFFAVLAPPQEKQPGVELFTQFKETLGQFNAVTGQKDTSFNATTDAMNQWTRTGVSQLIDSLDRVADSFAHLSGQMRSNEEASKSWGTVAAEWVDQGGLKIAAMLRQDAQDIEALGRAWLRLKDDPTLKIITENWTKWWQAYYDSTKKIWDWMTENLTNEKLFHGLQQIIQGPLMFSGTPTAGIIQQPAGSMLATSQAIGRRTTGGATTVNFSPSVTINGNASPAEQMALSKTLRDASKNFIADFKAAQQQERRLSYESGYA